jgi:pyruvate carboxylase
MQAMGDKTQARKLAEDCNVPVVPGSKGAVLTAGEAMDFAKQAGFPVMLKAAHGGGGRGMRVVRGGACFSLPLPQAAEPTTFKCKQLPQKLEVQ